MIIKQKMKYQFIFPKLALQLLIKIFGRVSSRRYAVAAQQYVSFANHILCYNGREMGTKCLKAIFGQAKRVLFGYTNEFVLYPIWIRCDSNSLPKKLRFLNKLLTSRSRLHRLFAISVFASFLAIRCKPSLDFSTVVKDSSSKVHIGLNTYISKVFVPYILHRAKKRFISLRPLKDLFLTKSDPYSKPSMVSAALTAAVLLKLYESGSSFAQSLVNFIQLQLGDKESILNRLRRLTYNVDLDKSHEPLRLMCIFVAPDRGGKTRIFTSAAYWVQYALYPLHDFLMRLLRSLPEDFTYKQDKSMDWMKTITRSGGLLYSFDLTAATDRFCFNIQKLLVRGLFGERFAGLWKTIVKGPIYIGHLKTRGYGTPYTSKGSIKSDFIRYNAGQPMGTYGSWALFALTHHAVVRYCFFNCRKSFYGKYAILGDDVVIADKEVADCYHALVTKYLGCDISISKSYIPEGDLSPGEFAKQLINKGVDFTPLTPDLLESAVTCSWVQFPEILQHALVRWGLKCGRNYTEPPRLARLCPSKKDYVRAMVLISWPSNSYIDLVPEYIWEEMNELVYDHAPAYSSTFIPERGMTDRELITIRGNSPFLPTELEEFKEVDDYVSTLSGLRTYLDDLSFIRLVESIRNDKLFKVLDEDFFSSLGFCETEQEVNDLLKDRGLDHPIARTTARLWWKWSLDMPLDMSSTVAILHGLKSALEYSKPSWRSRVVAARRIRDTSAIKAIRQVWYNERSVYSH